MEGLFYHCAQDTQSQIPGSPEGLSLLAKKGRVEIMTQHVNRGATLWLYAGESPDDMEFFFVHTGQIELLLSPEPVRLMPGDSFYIRGLKQNVRLRCVETALLVYMSNCPVFDEQAYWQEELQGLLRHIDEIDHYTKRHSHAVMRYALHLYEALRDHCPGLSMEDFIIGALFHDVGKCNVPGEILRKKERLTDEEYALIQQHAADSARILLPKYGPRIAELAHSHHERMDGSGYPRGLKGDQIPFESRILAVADAFDAMTSDRGYNRVKTFAEAAAELQAMPQRYDPLVTAALAQLVSTGGIRSDEEDDDAPGTSPAAQRG